MQEISYKPYVLARILGSTPPIIMGMFLFDLSFATDLSGSFTGLYLMLFVPMYSMSTMKLLPSKGPYDSWFNKKIFQYVNMVLSVPVFLSIWIGILLII